MRKYLLAASAIALAACGAETSDDSADSSAATQETSSATAAPASGDVLALFGLQDGGQGLISYESSSQRGDTTVFEGISINAGETPLSASSLTLKGAGQSGNLATFESMSVDGLIIVAPDGAGEINVGSFAIEEPSDAFANVVAGFMSGRSPEEFMEGFDPGAVNFGKVGVENVAAQFDGPDAQGAIGIGSFALSDLTQETLGSLALNAVEFDLTTPEGPFVGTLGEFSFSGINRPMFRELIDTITASNGTPEDTFAKMSQTAFFTDIYSKRLDGYALKDLAVNAAGLTIDLDDYSGTITETDTGVRYEDKIDSLSVASEGDGSLGGPAALQFAMLGYDSLDFQMRSVSTTNREADTVSLDEFVFEMEDGFTMDMNYTMGGFQEYVTNAMALLDADTLLEGEDPSPEVMTELYKPLVFHGFSMGLNDNGLADKAWTLGAAQSGQEVESLKAVAVAGVTSLAFMAPSEQTQQLAGQFIEAATSFINDAGSFRITIDPSEPVPVGPVIEQLSAVQETGEDPTPVIDELIADLNITIAAEAE